MSVSTQSYLAIKDIKNNVLTLKDGSIAMVLTTSAVNFDLLSENEQLAIISSFAGLLNSLSFYIQVVIRSKRLDITSYLGLLDKALNKQNNPLLKEMMLRYRVFIENTIKENDVLDKQFYVVVQVSRLEAGILNDEEETFQKAMTILEPRRDHLIRQFERIGLRANQLTTVDLVKLFFDYYNQEDSSQLPQLPQSPKTPQPPLTPPPTARLAPGGQLPQTPPTPKTPEPKISTKPIPFIVEELPDEYGVI